MTGGENRRRSMVKALRKRRIDRAVYPYSENGFYNNLQQVILRCCIFYRLMQQLF